MTKQELKKKRKQIVESKGYKEWEPQQEKLIAKRKEAQKNAEIQRRKVELSNKKDNGNAFTRNTEAKQYFKPTPANITTDNVNRRFQELMLEETKQEKEIEPQNKLFQNLNVSLSENKSNLANQKRADAKLSQEELDKLASMDRKGRVEALKGRSEKTLQEAELYALTKRNQETEKKVNEAKGVNKFLAANEYLAKEFAENTVSSFGQIKATADQIQGRDKDLSGLEYAQKYQEAISPLGQNVNSRFLQNLGIAAEGVGQQTPQILLGAAGAGALVGGFTEFANTYNEMTLEDPNNKTKTMITALLKGTVAGGLESALGLFGGGKLDKLSKSQLAGIKNKLVRNAMAAGYELAGENIEEQLENIIGYVIDKAVNDKDITMEQVIQEAEATFKQTSLTTLLMSALGLGGNTRREVNSIAERTNWVNQLNVTSPQKTELRRLAQDENITNEELYNQVMKIEQENAYQDTVYENIIKNAESTKKQQATIENKEVLNQSQQTTLKQGEMAQKQASSQLLGNEKYTIKMPNSNYKFVKSGDEKIDNFRQDVSQNWNNSKDTQKLVSTIETIMKDKGVAVRLDANITDEAGNILDGKYENGVITINPNSTKTFEYVATHELTHAIGTKEMLNMVQKYRESNKEFNSKLETILKNYNKSELTEEALADVSAELFGTQEFIANVKNTNPNLFQKIYNEIKYLWHQFRGYKNQNQFVEDLYNKWTKAYNSKAELNQTTKYSLAGEKALFADFSKLEKAKEMLKDNKDLDDIWIKTGWTKGDDGKWRFEIDDNKFDIKENSLTPDTEKPLHEILDAEELYDNYPELADINVITTKLEDGVNGSYERLGNVIYLSNDLISTTTQNKNYKFVGLHNQHKAFVSLLHEIQHYIQKQEGFARGGNVDEMRSAKNSKLRKLGERIDTLTAQYNKEIEEYRNSIHYNETVEELFKIDNPDERSEALYNYRESVKATPRYKEIEKIDDRIKELESEFYELEDISPFQLYKRLGGEQESSWVETRIETPSEKRKNKRPQYTNENTIFAETDDLMYNKQQRGNDDAIQLGNNLSTTSQSGQESGTPRRGGTDSRQSIETSSNGEIHRSIKGNNIVKGNNIQRSEGAVGHIDRGLEESSSFLMQDNKGRTLSKEQQEYFKDSKVRDENGNLLEMYHGSPNGEFTVFRDNSYFSANEEYAKGYENTWASSSGVMKETKTPKTYKVYLNITNPFTLSNPKAKEIYLKEYIKGGNSAYYDPYTDYTEDINNLDEVDWVEGEDLIDWLKENHPEFDGILFDEGGDGGYGEAEYRWRGKSFVPFNSNQIKNVDNTNPTDNPDIRYSKQNADWYDYVQDTFKTEGTRTTKDQITKDSDSETITEEEYTPTQKAINYEQRQKNNFKRNMSDMLGISQYNKNNKSIFNDAIDEMQKEYNATGTISQETKDRVFENMYNGLIKEDVAFYNENKEIKNEIRNTTLYVSDETKADITDYADFKRSVFGNVRLSNDKTDMPIDTFYKELSSQRPDLFPESIITTSEQLKRIAEVSKSIRKSERNLAAYNNNMEAAEYKKWAKNEFEIQTARLQEQFAFVNKYNESKQAEFEKKNIPYSRPDVAEIKSIYQNRNEIRKEVEKQERNLLLTDREKAIVNRLLNDEMDVSEIMPGYNKEGIIKSYYARQQLDYLDKEVKRYKQDKKQELYDMSENLISGIKDWKDKKIGLQYSRETAQRNIRDIMSKNEAEKINRELFDPIQENTANQIRFINDYNKQIEELELDKKSKYEWKDSEGKEIKIDEATLAQLLIEKKIDENYLTQVGADVEKIKNAANTFSRILNEVVDMMDDVYVEFGYAPVERRKNYFPHFIENKPDTLFSKIANALNFSTDVAELPTDIAGRTESFKPGRAFNRNILKRTTEKTDYNALKAIDMYLQGASDIIYHTADIQKLRAFQEAIRDNYRDVEIQKKILEIEENTEMTADERAEKIKEIKENIKTPLPKLVEWLDEYTNLLANKKSSGDRQTEKDLNRKMYTTMQEIEGKIASNLIGGNLSVSLTNVAPLFQAMGTTELGNIFVGMVQTAQNDIKTFNNKGDNFADASDFLTSRRGNELLQKQTVKQNISNVAGIPMQVIDNFVSESIVRAKYRENIKKGMDNDAALKAADTYARNLMADRSKGALPTIFARKNPVSKLMTSFQVEPNNIISNYFKDMKYDAETKSELAWQAVKLSAASFVFNEVLKSIRGGSDVIPNPIGIASRLIALAMTNLNDDEEDDLDEIEVLKEIGSDLLGSIPFGTTVANTLSVLGVEGFEDTGRFMTSNAIPSAGKLIGLVGEDVSPEYRKQTLIEELSKPLIYLGLPTAGSQISKTAKGLKAFVEGGSYKYNKKGERQLQFPVEQNVTNAVKSTVFGKYSLPGGTKYIDEGFKSLNGKETMVYEQSSVNFDELKTYFEYSKKDGVKKKDKINYLESMDISSDDKWNLYKHNIISNTEREDGTSQLSDAEFVINNNMATPEEYMKMYSKAERNEVEFPGTETLQELKDSGLSLKTYMDYKTKLTLGNRKKKAEYEAKNNMPLSKEETEKRKTLNTEEKIALLEKYSDREKALIYENYIGKSDTVYQHLKQLTGDNVRINDYLDYKIADLDSDRKNDGTKKGKAIPGSAEKKLVNFLNNSKLSNIERIYIYGQTYELDNSQRQQFQNYIRKLNLPYAEEKEIWLDLSSSNVVEMSNGSIEWK